MLVCVWGGGGVLYLRLLVMKRFPWLQKVCGSGEPDAVQAKWTSPPRENFRVRGITITEGASAKKGPQL